MGCSDIERLMQYFNGVSEMMELFEALEKRYALPFRRVRAGYKNPKYPMMHRDICFVRSLNQCTARKAGPPFR